MGSICDYHQFNMGKLMRECEHHTMNLIGKILGKHDGEIKCMSDWDIYCIEYWYGCWWKYVGNHGWYWSIYINLIYPY